MYKLLGTLTGDGPSMFEVLGVEALVLGIVVATISAAIAVKWLVHYLTRHGLALFGWYRIALGVVVGALMLVGVLDM